MTERSSELIEGEGLLTSVVRVAVLAVIGSRSHCGGTTYIQTYTTELCRFSHRDIFCYSPIGLSQMAKFGSHTVSIDTGSDSRVL